LNKWLPPTDVVLMYKKKHFTSNFGSKKCIMNLKYKNRNTMIVNLQASVFRSTVEFA